MPLDRPGKEVLALLGSMMMVEMQTGGVACARQVSTSNLERVRKVKTRHQRLLARVTTVREELQRFLEDDDDMAKMCLTRKKELERKVSVGARLPPACSEFVAWDS